MWKERFQARWSLERAAWSAVHLHGEGCLISGSFTRRGLLDQRFIYTERAAWSAVHLHGEGCLISGSFTRRGLLDQRFLYTERAAWSAVPLHGEGCLISGSFTWRGLLDQRFIYMEVCTISGGGWGSSKRAPQWSLLRVTLAWKVAFHRRFHCTHIHTCLEKASDKWAGEAYR